MRRVEARELKNQMLPLLREYLRAELEPVETAGYGPGVALGLATRREDDFGLAVRYTQHSPTVESALGRLREQVGEDLDVRYTGAILALGTPPPDDAPAETGRVRPLRPGISIAHHAVSAGTLGGFATLEGDDAVYALSNWHVPAGSPEATVGDEVLQPGPADGGTSPDDRVGELAEHVPLSAGSVATVDAALARLDDPEVDPSYPVGVLQGPGSADGDDVVQKTGRTTGTTEGRVSAIELDGVVVGYGPELGDLTFDGQIEVESTGPGPFSEGGDSGSLVYRPEDRLAVGLLFAGSEVGGENGLGLTYLNPLEDVLTALRATLL